MADLRPYNFKKPKELRQIIGQLIDENQVIATENKYLRERLAEVAPSIDDSDIDYTYKWVCPQCHEVNEGEFGFGGANSLIGDTLECDHCNAEVEVLDK